MHTHKYIHPFAMQCSFDSSLIPRLHFPSLLGLLTDPSLLPGSVLLYIYSDIFR